MGTGLIKERIGQIQSNLLKYYKYSEKDIAGLATADLDTEAVTRAFRYYINDSNWFLKCKVPTFSESSIKFICP